MIAPIAKYDLNDLQCDVGHLHHLLDAIADQLLEGVEFTDGNRRNPGVDRLNALVWIARDLGRGLDEKVAVHFQEIGSTTAGGRHEHAAS